MQKLMVLLDARASDLHAKTFAGFRGPKGLPQDSLGTAAQTLSLGRRIDSLTMPRRSAQLDSLMITKLPLSLLGVFLVSSLSAHEPVTQVRTPVNLPEVPGYITLKADFHMHTVFSDGLVWPSVRAEEAWRQGLDAFAVTDHIEYQPHKADLTTNHNRSHEIARGAGEALDLIVVKGSEITRSMPPGHLNAIFLKDSELLVVKNWQDAVQAAHDQGAFIFWNHPGWERQITNGMVLWYPEHTQLLEKGQLHGIEVVNGRDYYPEAHRWAIEKKLAMLSNSDVHAPIGHDYHVHTADHRPITLVFASARTPEALREALFARRTAVYSANRLVGDEAFLRPIFEGSIRLNHSKLALKKNQSATLQLSNSSEIEYELTRVKKTGAISAPETLILPAGKTIRFSVRRGAGQSAEGLTAPTYRINNLLVGPDQPLEVRLPLEVQAAP